MQYTRMSSVGILHPQHDSRGAIEVLSAYVICFASIMQCMTKILL